MARLDGLTRRLRTECPWDREQDERSIVPHTVEEAYELADAAASGDDARLLDELGDVLFQVHFLALLMEERGAGDLATVAEHCAQKLIRRHPHVFGEAQAADAQAVLRNWDAIKRSEEGRGPGATGDLPGNLPATIYARKLQSRAAAAGRPRTGAAEALANVAEEAARLSRTGGGATPGRSAGPGDGPLEVGGEARAADEPFERVGELLHAAVAAAEALGVDAELALRAAADRRREREDTGVPGDGGAGGEEDRTGRGPGSR